MIDESENNTSKDEIVMEIKPFEEQDLKDKSVSEMPSLPHQNESTKGNN